MSVRKSEYAQAGVDYTKIEPFKQAMSEIGKKTLDFPNRRSVYVYEHLSSHGAVYSYQGPLTHVWCNTQEGLGNKNWIAEWMYQHAGTGRTYYENIGVDAALMAVNDCIAQGAMPVVYTDEVAAGDSEWFEDEQRSKDLASGFYKVCELVGMALPAGESSSLRYLIRAEPPVTSAPSLSGCVTGIIAPAKRLIKGRIKAGDTIIGVTSSGLHANGISLVIKKALEFPDQFLTKLPNGNTLGEEALIPTRSYVALVEALLEAEIDINALLPGTGSGISKIASYEKPFTYYINSWINNIPQIFQFMLNVGVSEKDCFTTFNWGIGYYIFVHPDAVQEVMNVGVQAGYNLFTIGKVEEGERKVVFRPGNVILPPPGE